MRQDSDFIRDCLADGLTREQAEQEQAFYLAERRLSYQISQLPFGSKEIFVKQKEFDELQEMHNQLRKQNK